MLSFVRFFQMNKSSQSHQLEGQIPTQTSFIRLAAKQCARSTFIFFSCFIFVFIAIVVDRIFSPRLIGFYVTLIPCFTAILSTVSMTQRNNQIDT